eukprot:SAG22_NODE_242_length_14104_cov_13.581935_3_plen_81_part_00
MRWPPLAEQRLPPRFHFHFHLRSWWLVCRLELQFAKQSGIPIIPVIIKANYKASGWCGGKQGRSSSLPVLAFLCLSLRPT